MERLNTFHEEKQQQKYLQCTFLTKTLSIFSSKCAYHLSVSYQGECSRSNNMHTHVYIDMSIYYVHHFRVIATHTQATDTRDIQLIQVKSTIS